MQRNSFEQFISDLHKKNYVLYINREKATLTEGGKDELKKYNLKIEDEVNQLNGLKYQTIASIFEKRLYLFIQTITNILSTNTNFVPITDDLEVQYWVKSVYKENSNQLDKWLKGIYEELNLFLTGMNNEHATIFVESLTGYSYFGLSKNQIADKHQIDKHDVHIISSLIIHSLIEFIRKNKFLYLFTFINDLIDQDFITDSARRTYELYKKGFSINQIAYLRKLKESTIQDHIIEIAYINPQFKVDNFVSTDALNKIKEKIKEAPTRKLKDIRQNLSDEFTYFQIRLVLALIEVQSAKETRL